MFPRLIVLVAAIVALNSCRDDFTLEADFRDLPVAYGFLDAADERHFLRVQKAFLEAGGDATANAGIADSIYYAPGAATVLLTNLATLETVELERVDGTQFGLDRTDGVFATNPNVLYTATDERLNLRPGQRVRLTIERPGEEAATAETVLLDDLTINRPTDVVRIDDPRRPLIMSWSKGEHARVYDVRVHFRLRELFPATPERNRDVSLTWVIASAYVPDNDDTSTSLVRFEVDPAGFYQFLGGALAADPTVVRRFLDFDVAVTAAGQEVLDRRNLESANAGITGAQSLPRYSNLAGGLGLLTSRTSGLRTGIQFDGGSLDSLREGQYTRDLNFQ